MGRRKTTNEFIEAAMQKHPEFDYSETRYIDKYTKVKIICPIHGAFEIIPRNFFRYKHGCGKCGQKLNTTDVFIEKCIKKYGTKFSYTKVNYINSTTNVTITCPIHGDFEQNPTNHLTRTQAYLRNCWTLFCLLILLKINSYNLKTLMA